MDDKNGTVRTVTFAPQGGRPEQQHPMRVKEVPVEIVCPTWCVIDAETHAAEIWDYEGTLIHHSDDIVVHDPGRGPGVNSLEDPKPASSIAIDWTSQTNPGGVESHAPMFRVEGHEISVEQAVALSAAIDRAVAEYRAAGGAL